MDPLLLTAIRAADAAARVHSRWGRRIGIEAATLKGRGDFVSRADIEAQEAALAVIREAFPEHDILAEEDEEAARVGGERPLWVVDPLDGTANFLHGHPMYAASVAVAVDGKPSAGAVSCATTGERWWGVRGGGAFKNGRPIRVSSQPGMEGSLLGTGFPFKILDRVPEYLAQLGRVLYAGAGVRRGGSASLDLCYLAEGRLDGFWELLLKPWDFAAGIVIVEEAGGVITDWNGDPLPLEAGAVLAANSPVFLNEMTAVLKAEGTGGAPAAPAEGTAAAPEDLG